MKPQIDPSEKVDNALFNGPVVVQLGDGKVELKELPWKKAREIKKQLVALFKSQGLDTLLSQFTDQAKGDSILPFLATNLEKLLLDLPEPFIDILKNYINACYPGRKDTAWVYLTVDDATEKQIIHLAKEVFGLLASPLLELISSVSAPVNQAVGMMKGMKAAGEPGVMEPLTMDEAILKD